MLSPSGPPNDARGRDAEEDEALEAQLTELSRGEQWEDLIAVLIEAAEGAPDPRVRARRLLRAGRVFETNLRDAEKAALILQTALQEDPTSDDVGRELARVAMALGRWEAVLAELTEAATGLDATGRAALLSFVGRAYLGRGDETAAERSLVAALHADPSAPEPRRTLATLYERRGRWDQVVSVDPTNIAATEALADSASVRGAWAEAVPLLEALVPAYEPRSQADRAQLQRRLGRAAQESGDVDKARAAYRRAHELDASDLDVVGRWAQLAIDHGWWQEARALHEQLLARAAEAEMTPVRQVEVSERLGRACVALGDQAAGLAAFRRGLEIDPDHQGCRAGALAAAQATGDKAAAVEHQRALLKVAPPSSQEDRFDLLLKLARTERDELGDAEGAIKAFLEALALRPGDQGLLHEVLDLMTAAKQWKRAVAVLQQLAATETGKAKARYLVATANILNYELHAVDEAVELYNEALDEDPEDLKSFERIDKILTAKRAWRDEARNYRRMIKRIGTGPENRAALLALWRGLGEIYRTRLKDLPAAAAAYEVCSQLTPGDDTYQEILAEIHELEGAAGLPQAVMRRTILLESAQTPDAAAKHLRVLRRLYSEHRQWDRVWCVCAALVACGQADDKEREFYDRYAGPGVPIARAGVTEEIWSKTLYHPREDRRVSQIFAAVSASVALVRAKEARAWGLDDRRRVNADGDASPLTQVLTYASRLLGVGCPALYLHAEVPGEIDLANVIDGAHLVPSFVAGGDLLNARSEKELAFILAKKIALLRPEHLVLWPHVVPTRGELKIILVSVMKLFHPALEPGDVDASALKRYLSLFQRTLAPHALEPLMAVLPALLNDTAGVDVNAWAEGADHTANRAALVVCGDVVAATRVIVEEARARGANADLPVASLVRWSVSSEYLTLREQLGMALGNDGAAPSGPGVPVARAGYR